MSMMYDNKMNLSNYLGINFKLNVKVNAVEDNDVISQGGLNFEIIHTPGHTRGGICIKLDDMVFTGDTLFQKAIGRTDFCEGNVEQLKESIKGKLFLLDDNTVVYPGHGFSTQIIHEKKSNPFLSEGI